MKQLPNSLKLSPREEWKLWLNRQSYYELCDQYLESKVEETKEVIKKEIEWIIGMANI